MYATGAYCTFLPFLISKIKCTEFKKSQSMQALIRSESATLPLHSPPYFAVLWDRNPGISGTAIFCLSGNSFTNCAIDALNNCFATTKYGNYRTNLQYTTYIITYQVRMPDLYVLRCESNFVFNRYRYCLFCSRCFLQLLGNNILILM
jgi:hypothetical protein